MLTETTPLVIAGRDGNVIVSSGDSYWHNLENEDVAAGFLNVTRRTMQSWRQKGGGPKFIRLSARCIRYRRTDLKQWADSHLRGSTAESA